MFQKTKNAISDFYIKQTETKLLTQIKHHHFILIQIFNYWIHAFSSNQYKIDAIYFFPKVTILFCIIFTFSIKRNETEN